jgi:hypothetical protein
MSAAAGLAAWLALCLCAVAPVAAREPARPPQRLGAPLPPPRPPEITPKTEAPVAPPKSEAPAAAAAAEPPGCLRALTAVPGNVVRAVELKPEAADCAVTEPVEIEALAVRNDDGPGQIRLLPPPTVSCELARVFAAWVDTSLQPLARGSFERNLTALRVGGGHECRRRNRRSQGVMSEHATGRALDIFAFRFGDEKKGGLEISVEKPQGLAQSRFLDAVRQSACGAFMTVLGPGSDAAHANHLHVDIQQRRAASSRFCQ